MADQVYKIIPEIGKNEQGYFVRVRKSLEIVDYLIQPVNDGAVH